MIQPIVEGQGDERAVPVLLRKLLVAAEVWSVAIGKPHRKQRTKLLRKDELQSAVKVAALQANCAAILILFDADDDCPKDVAPTLEQWANEVSGGRPCSVVMANREYEAWFLASMESLRGTAGILTEATSHPHPEGPRDAKGELERRMPKNAAYSPTVDQAQLTAHLDLRSAYQRSRSFRKLVRAFGILAAASGAPLTTWPPPDWAS